MQPRNKTGNPYLRLLLTTSIIIAVLAVSLYRFNFLAPDNLNEFPTIITNLLTHASISSQPNRIDSTMSSITSSGRPAIIVVGSGLAGLSAAASILLQRNSSLPPVPVLMLERAAKHGGNSIKASSGINGAVTPWQRAMYERENTAPDKQDSVEQFIGDTIKSGGVAMRDSATAARTVLVDALAGGSRDAIEWLTDDMCIDLRLVAQLGGHSRARTHRGSGKLTPGFALVNGLLERLRELEKDGLFDLLTNCEVTELTTDSGNTAADTNVVVTGVEAVIKTEGEGVQATRNVTFKGPVVFAAGGFGGDPTGLLAKYRADLTGMPSTSSPWPGAHPILERVGAKLVDMYKVQVHPTGFVDPKDPVSPSKFLAAEVLRGEGGILLHKGKRFVNEMETREHVSNEIMKLPKSQDQGGENIAQWDIQLLLDPGAIEATATHMGFYTFKGFLTKKKISELDETTQQSIKDWAAVVDGKRQDQFGRTSFGRWRLKGTDDEYDTEVAIGRVTPIVHFTMGGVVIDPESRVLATELADELPKHIEGLWAAGEITGGLHGDNRLGGSSLLECVVFGRKAGQNALEYFRNKHEQK